MRKPNATNAPVRRQLLTPRNIVSIASYSLAATTADASLQRFPAMPVWPKSFYTFGLGAKTASTEWKLRKKNAATAQDKAFAALIPKYGATTFWRDVGIDAGMPYARFQSKVPLQTYEQLAPAIRRMKHGESDVLWPGQCALFARTSGTSSGEPKHLPVTEEMLAHFHQGGLDALLYYTVRVKHAGVFRGRHLLVGGATALAPVAEANGHEAYIAELDGIAALSAPAWADRHLFEPGAEATKLADWEARLDAIINRTCHCDISLLAGIPTWILQLAKELRERCANSRQPVAHLQLLWPNFECFVHTGVPVAPYAAQLRETLGPTVKLHEIYLAAEGFVAAQDSDAAGSGLRVMADLGVFFEFLPMTEYDETRVQQLGAKAVPLADVKVGLDYALVMSTPAGLARTLLGDVVRFVSTKPHRLIYVGRTALQLNAFGERVMEKEVTDALVAVCERHQWTIVNFHVAPLLATGGHTSQVRGRHEWWVELKPGTVVTPIGPQIAAELEAEVQRACPEYAAKRKAGVMDSPTVRLVMPGVFEHWLRYRQRWGGQNKLARCRSDRLLADELAQITNFARD